MYSLVWQGRAKRQKRVVIEIEKSKSKLRNNPRPFLMQISKYKSSQKVKVLIDYSMLWMLCQLVNHLVHKNLNILSSRIWNSLFDFLHNSEEFFLVDYMQKNILLMTKTLKKVSEMFCKKYFISPWKNFNSNLHRNVGGNISIKNKGTKCPFLNSLHPFTRN